MTDKAEYQRQYRARLGGLEPSQKARNRAETVAARLFRQEQPERWHQLLAAERARLGLVDDGSGRFGRKPIKHGTYAGACAHRYRGEPLCDACRRARNEHAAERRRAKKGQP